MAEMVEELGSSVETEATTCSFGEEQELSLLVVLEEKGLMILK